MFTGIQAIPVTGQKVLFCSVATGEGDLEEL